VIRFGSACSGIEAASVAWHPLGWRASFLSEIEPFPRAVLAHHYPEAPLHGDFTTIEAGQYKPIDLLVGGTPCQSFSVAGLRGGLGDDRGNLALEYLRLADRLRPRWLVWENVPGVLSSAGGRDFGAILGGMVELGYGIAYRVLDAQFFGVAQRRRRVFVVGHLGDWRRAAAVLFERHSLQGHPAPSREAGQRPAGTVGASSGDWSRDHIGESIIAFGSKEHAQDAGDVAPPLRAMGSRKDHPNGGGQLAVAYSIMPMNSGTDYKARAVDVLQPLMAGGNASSAQGGDVIVTPTLDSSAPHAVAFALRGREGGAMPEIGGDQIGALRSASGGSSRDYVAFAHQGGGVQTRLGYDPEAKTCQTLGANQTPAIAGSAVRRLTPRECERLQGFPDDYTLIPWRKGLAPDGPRYKALGNSMAVPVMAHIGRRIEAVEALSAHEAAA
jgi:DNA (cytosine-5)-methyltransferase 1